MRAIFRRSIDRSVQFGRPTSIGAICNSESVADTTHSMRGLFLIVFFVCPPHHSELEPALLVSVGTRRIHLDLLQTCR